MFCWPTWSNGKSPPRGSPASTTNPWALASALASQFDLPYPTLHSIAQCRDKRLCKTGVGNVRRALSAQPAHPQRHRTVCLHGSHAQRPMRAQAPSRQRQRIGFPPAPAAKIATRLFRRSARDLSNAAPAACIAPPKTRNIALAEELIVGEEYSCDFMLDGDQFQTLRLTHKIPLL